MDLEDIIQLFQDNQAIRRKKAIGPILEIFQGKGKVQNYGLGDDSGYLPADGHFILLTNDAIREELLEKPDYAGFCAVTVAVNDIYATGGIPLALVNCLHVPEGEENWAQAVAEGLKEGCRFHGIQVLGGHVDYLSSSRGLSVSLMGRASKLMTTFGAVPDDLFLFVYDPDGSWDEDMLIWDSTSRRDEERITENYGLLLEIAEGELVTACRDVSNAGLLGTLAMLTEASGVGAWVDLVRISKPEGVSMEKWCFCYPSFGFLFTVKPEKIKGVTELFRLQGLEACCFGEVREGNNITFALRGKETSINNPLSS